MCFSSSFRTHVILGPFGTRVGGFGAYGDYIFLGGLYYHDLLLVYWAYEEGGFVFSFRTHVILGPFGTGSVFFSLLFSLGATIYDLLQLLSAVLSSALSSVRLHYQDQSQ